MAQVNLNRDAFTPNILKRLEREMKIKLLANYRTNNDSYPRVSSIGHIACSQTLGCYVLFKSKRIITHLSLQSNNSTFYTTAPL